MVAYRLGKQILLGSILWAMGFVVIIHDLAEARSREHHHLESRVNDVNILVIHSYNPELSWTQEIKEGIDQGFQNSPYETTVFHEFLDAKRYPKLHHRSSFLEGIQNKYQHTDIDLVMVADDPGLSLVLESHREYFSELPVVFMGINHVEEKFLNIPWLTGVFESHSVAETIIEAQRQTGTDHVIIITDSTETGAANQKLLKGITHSTEGLENYHILEDITSAEIRSKIAPYPDTWPIFLSGQIRRGDHNGPLISFSQGAEILQSSVPNPIYVDTSVLLGHGSVGGKVLDGTYHAQQAVQLAEQLLSGASPDQVTPILEAKNQWIFDAQELEKINININSLPPGSILINQKLSLYQQNPEIVWLAIVGLSLSLVIIVILSNAIRRQKIAESKLRANEKQLEQKVHGRTAELRTALSALQQSQSETEERSIELAKKNSELEIARLSADKANQAKSDFLAKMSHELRTPLNSILGFTQLLQRDPVLPTKHQNYINIIRSSSSHLLNLINNVLDLSKVEAGKSRLNKTDFNLESLLESVCQMLEPEANRKGLFLSCCYESGLPKYIHQDAAKIKQIIINVVGNAVKFTAYGQVTLKAETLTDHQLQLTIRDTGPGIGAQDIEQLFDPFSQAQGGYSPSEGTGLGLSISAEFIKLMGGAIEVKSEIDQGSLFIITLPFELAKETTDTPDKYVNLQPTFEDSDASSPEGLAPQVSLITATLPVDTLPALSQSLSRLPQTWLQQLVKAASSLSDTKVETVLNNLPQGHELLLTHISHLKADFRYDLIVQMVEPYLQPGNSPSSISC